MLESFHRKHSKPATSVSNAGSCCVWGSCETSREHLWWHIVLYGFSCYWSVDLKIFVIWFVSFYVLLSQWRMHFDALNSKLSEEQAFPCENKTSWPRHQAQIVVDFASIFLFFACIRCLNVQHIRRICLPTVKTLTWYFCVVMQPCCICKMGIFVRLLVFWAFSFLLWPVKHHCL